MTPFFSVIIPVYNTAPYLGECLNSLLSQTVSDWECICVDDGSTDGSIDILNEYAARDPRFFVFKQENAGPAVARNRGIQEARGKWLLFMDADDLYPDSEVLSFYLECIQCAGVSIIGGSLVYCCKDNGDQRYADAFVQQEFMFEKEGEMPYTDYQREWGFYRFAYQTELVRKYGLHFPDLRGYEDPWFFVNAMLAAKTFFAKNRVVYCYRQHPDKIPSRDRLADTFDGLRQLNAIAIEHHLDKLSTLLFQRFCIYSNMELSRILEDPKLWYVMIHAALAFGEEATEAVRHSIVKSKTPKKRSLRKKIVCFFSQIKHFF